MDGWMDSVSPGSEGRLYHKDRGIWRRLVWTSSATLVAVLLT